MAEYKFPTEIVDLPSKGHFYMDGHPLSTGKVEVKYMTAKEEDILTSQNLIKQGTVIDVLLQSLIVDKSIKIDDLLVGDKNAIMVAARVLGYGKDYQFEYDGVEQKTDLSILEPKELDFDKIQKGINEFPFELPNSKRKITFKLLNGRDEKEIELEVKARGKISKGYSSELTTRLKKIIKSVDGNAELHHISNFIDNEFLSVDSLAFRRHMGSITPDVEMNATILDSSGKELTVAIPITVRFFWPTS